MDRETKFLFLSWIIEIVMVLTIYSLSNMCINNIGLHEWLHHIGACLSGIPNIQLPTATMLWIPFYIYPQGVILFPGQTPNAKLSIEAIIPLADVSFATNFPYMIAKLILMIPTAISVVMIPIFWKRNSTILFSFFCAITTGLIISCILTFPYINEMLLNEWINNIFNFTC